MAERATLFINTRGGMLKLGDAPPTRTACGFCGGPAQIATGTVAACARCTVDALETAAHIAATPGAPTDPSDPKGPPA